GLLVTIQANHTTTSCLILLQETSSPGTKPRELIRRDDGGCWRRWSRRRTPRPCAAAAQRSRVCEAEGRPGAQGKASRIRQPLQPRAWRGRGNYLCRRRRG
ncbi:hypothetical protein TCAP_03802, partial [Tolypocladium capitatum]